MTADTVRRYLAGTLTPGAELDFERGLTSAVEDLVELSANADADRLVESRLLLFAEIDTPAPSRTERFVRRLGLGETTARLVAATPTFRRSFAIAIVAMILFTAATANSGEGVNRLLVFLTLAPALPLLGTALAFGPSADPMHEVTVSTPIQGFRLVLIRTFAVYLASLGALIPGSIFITEIGVWRWAWLLPGLALTTCALALSTRVQANVAAGVVGLGWLSVVTVVALSTTDDVVLFRPGGQLVFLGVAAIGAAVTVWRRQSFEEVGST